jgi:hypothetical protein
MIVHAANLAMFLVFVNRLLFNRKLQPPLIALDVGNYGSLNSWGGARPTPASWPGLTRPSTRFGAADDSKGAARSKSSGSEALVTVRADAAIRLRGVDGRVKPGHDVNS